MTHNHPSLAVVTAQSNSVYHILLRNVLHALEIKKNLLSVTQLTNDNISLQLKDNECDNSDELIAKATKKDNLYILEAAEQCNFTWH